MFNIDLTLYRNSFMTQVYRSILIFLFILLSGSICSVSAQFLTTLQQLEKLDSQARNAMQQGNYAIAYCIWQPLAQHGNSSAQYNLGWMYHNGYGLSIDDEMALNWWLKSAASGDANSHFALGELYAQGQGVEQDMSISLGWYISAALKGHEPAQETLLALLSSNDSLSQNTFQQLLQTDWSILGDTMQVNVDKANTRRGPDKSYKIVSTLHKGHVVIPLREQNGWTYIGITGTGETAWIFSQLIRQPAGIYPLK